MSRKKREFTQEEFEAWSTNPITEAVFAYLKEYAATAKEMWLQQSWDQGHADPLQLADLRARAQTAEDLSTIALEDIQGHAEGSDGFEARIGLSQEKLKQGSKRK